jgi:hypothetical protein
MKRKKDGSMISVQMLSLMNHRFANLMVIVIFILDINTSLKINVNR